MAPNEKNTVTSQKSPLGWISIVLILIGLAAFIYGAIGDHPEKAWQAYLIKTAYNHPSGDFRESVVFVSLDAILVKCPYLTPVLHEKIF